MEKRFLKVKEVAQYLGVSTNTIRAWVRLGKVNYSKINGAVRFDVRKVDQWVAKKNISIN